MDTIDVITSMGLSARTAEGVVYADRLASEQQRPRIYPAGRTCPAPGCHTILSVYNGTSHCSLHQALEPYGPYRVHRTRRMAKLRAPAA
jgi:hypothetical protein